MNTVQTSVDTWHMTVRSLMRQGLGYEDIAVITKTSPQRVREYAQHLAEMGRLDGLYRGGAA